MCDKRRFIFRFMNLKKDLTLYGLDLEIITIKSSLKFCIFIIYIF